MYRQRNNGFTLIELLVVIAIIALLVSILLPSLSYAKILAQNAVCLSNLKGIGTGLNMYSGDNDGNLPKGPYAFPTSTGANWYTGDGKWVYELVDKEQYVAKGNNYSVANPTIASPMPQAFFCPLDDTYLNWCIAKQADTRHGYAGYCYFGGFQTLGADGWKGPQTVVDSDNPTATELMSDLMQSQGGLYNYTKSSSHVQTKTPGNNTFFLDGHIEFKSLGDMEEKGYRHSYSSNFFYW